jgi:hypothetical protein
MIYAIHKMIAWSKNEAKQNVRVSSVLWWQYSGERKKYVKNLLPMTSAKSVRGLVDSVHGGLMRGELCAKKEAKNPVRLGTSCRGSPHSSDGLSTLRWEPFTTRFFSGLSVKIAKHMDQVGVIWWHYFCTLVPYEQLTMIKQYHFLTPFRHQLVWCNCCFFVCWHFKVLSWSCFLCMLSKK